MRENRRAYYAVAAVSGAIFWGVLGTMFGDALLAHFLTWDELTPLQELAEISFYVLTLPALLFEPILSEPKLMPPVVRNVFLCLLYGLNGCVWGAALAFLYQWVRKRR